ncbi:MAG: ATP-binding protein [Anaerovoracaceae bacterium]|jgi:signal transduction histidine kinase
MNKRFSFDFHSVKFRIWVYFMLFAALILGAIWCMQYLFLDSYYARSKLNETSRLSNEIAAIYNQTGGSLSVLNSMILKLSQENDVTIFVQTTDGRDVMSAGDVHRLNDDSRRNNYEEEIETLRNKLQSSNLDSTSIISRDKKKARSVWIAKRLTGSSSITEISGSEYILFIFSPLFPLKATLDILRQQLVIIILAAMLVSLIISYYLSMRISRPIRKITNSASELSSGNFDVRFEGNSYSEINELAETLTKAEGEMKRIDLYQKDLMANVSHDLRTPLTMIRSYAEMIRDISGDNPEKRNKHLDVIIEESDRLNTLVNDMLNLSRLQSRRLELDLTDFDLAEAASSVMGSYRILNETEDYDIRYEDHDQVFPVNADEQKIKQVMSNLISNAVKYCGEDKYIMIELRKTGRKVRFSVTDHGQGIAPDEIAHVWDRYYKSSTHHVRPTEGSGLGLSIVKELLTLHGATFDVKSKLGKGSTFWFELPLTKGQSK